MIKRVRGTQDVLDTKLQNFVLGKLKKYIALYNFSEIHTPILEHTKLFVRSLGEQTDVVCKEMYILDEEKKKDSLCLRPEATASTIRAYIENSVEDKPWKVFSFGPMFRRERPQKGRWRQFSQINIEVVNSDSILQDVHFIKMLDKFFDVTLNLEDYVIKLNFLGCKKDRETHKEKLYEYLEQSKTEICETCLVRKEKNILRVFDCKNEDCQKIYSKAPKLTDFLCGDCNEEWEKLKTTLQILSVNYVHDPYLVRGLDYYNKTVFEFCSNDLGSQNSFAGGGRYSLGKDIGSKKDYPSIGVGIGMGRLLLLVEKNQNKINIEQDPALHLILPMSKEQKDLALLIADELICNNFCTDVLLEGASIKSMMRKANKVGSKYVFVIGDDEQKNGTVSIKNMQTGDSVIIKQDQIVNYLHNKKI